MDFNYIWAMPKYSEFSTEPQTYYSWHVFVRRYFSLSFYLINLKFWHNIPRVVRRGAMTLLSVLPDLSMISWITILLNGKRQFLLTCKVSRYCTMLFFKCKRQYLLTLQGLHGSTSIIESNVRSIVYTSSESPFIARRVNRVPLCVRPTLPFSL